MAPSLSPAEVATMIALHRAGWSAPKIAAELGRRQEAVRDRLAAEGLRLMKPPRCVPYETMRGVVLSYTHEGLSIRQCAARHGLPVKTTRRVLVSLGVPLRPRGASRRSA